MRRATALSLLACVLGLALAAGWGLARYRHDRRLHQLRRQPADTLSAAAVEAMLRHLDFFDAHRNPRGRGVAHRYEPRAGGEVIFDGATGLSWQRGGSRRALSFVAAREEITRLNAAAFAGRTDWRLPTVEEAMSLMEPERRSGGLHLDPLFDPEPWWIWTADREGPVGPWVVYFYGGNCFVHVPLGGSAYVRGVRP